MIRMYISHELKYNNWYEKLYISIIHHANKFTLPRYKHFRYFYRPQKKLRKTDVFTRVCYSVQRPPSPRMDTPLQNRYPIPPPPPHHTSGGHCSGQYASYWNAYLVTLNVYKNLLNIFQLATAEEKPFVDSTLNVYKVTVYPIVAPSP